jgi:hypothetical protein
MNDQQQAHEHDAADGHQHDGLVICPVCGHGQPDKGRGVKCEKCGHGPMPTNK